MRVAVVGGTGVVGRHVVDALTTGGHLPVVLARSAGIDVTTGAGLDDALAGVEAVVDVSNVTTMRRSTAVAFFEAATTQLLSAGQRAGVRHHVVLSIVGIDDVDYGYYEGKRRQERLARDGAVPVSILRSTQFHEFPGQVLGQAVGPVAVAPRMRVQPVAAAEVGAALATLAVGPPVGRAPDLAGPEVHDVVDLARRLVRAQGRRRIIVPVRLPGEAGRRMASGALLPGPDADAGTVTFDAWLRDAAR
jgi:uncharacterized protein YbjT (DUF2867 family)